MQEIIPNQLWTGHAGDLLQPAQLELAGVKAVLQVAHAEPIPQLSRDLLIAHFPIGDGSGNPRGIVSAAIGLAANLIRSKTPTLVCCSAGMSRSLCIAAGGWAAATGRRADEVLAEVIEGKPHDVSPALWADVCAAVERESR